MIRVAILGSTGSIGRSTLEIMDRHPERFRVVALAAGNSLDVLADQVRKHRPAVAVLGNEDRLKEATDLPPATWRGGREALLAITEDPEVDVVVNALVGAVGLEPTLRTLRAGKRLALANKESLVAGGELVISAAKEGGGELIPVDSEHSAILQCLMGYEMEQVAGMVLTASGGPFRGWEREALENVHPSQALNHPTWSMGAKISIDSATLANKALEVIEAHFLYGIDYDSLGVVVHPQSIVHSFVEFVDGSVLAQMGFPTMELPILFALSYPERVGDGALRTFDAVKASPLEFEDVDRETFSLFSLGERAGRTGGAAPAVYNAANEIAVGAFLGERIRFPEMTEVVSETMDRLGGRPLEGLEQILHVDGEARVVAEESVLRLENKKDVMTVLATIVVLGVLIFVHELGHFWAAKLVGVEVERFSIGLGPRVWGFTWGETEYVFSLIPLGGYVKMGGMEDEVMDRLEGGAAKEPRVPGPRDFDGKPIWARGLVFSAGVLMNMVFAFGIYVGVTGIWGIRELATTRVGQVYESTLPAGSEALASLPVGADLVRVGEEDVEIWRDITTGIVQAEPGPLTLEYINPRGSLEIQVPASEEDRIRVALALRDWVDAEVGAVNPGSPAEKGGLEVGDVILSVDNGPVVNWYDFLDAIESRPDARVELGILREGRELTRVVTLDSQDADDPVTGDKVTVGQIGIWQPSDSIIYTAVSPSQAVVMGYRQTVAVTGLILGFLRDLVTGNVSPRSVGSIVTIGAASGQAAEEGLDTFLSFMALFSINLAILNLLPIPVLDGGHLLFLGIEALRGGKALSVEHRLRWSQVGFVVLLGIMVWALSNDFMRLLGL